MLWIQRNAKGARSQGGLGLQTEDLFPDRIEGKHVRRSRVDDRHRQLWLL